MPSSGNRHDLFRQQRDERILHFGGRARDFLEAYQLALLETAKDRAGHQRLGAGAFRQQQGVVPAVANLLLGGAGGALHHLQAVAANRCGQMFTKPAFCGSRFTDKQQGPVGGERGNGNFDDALVAQVLRPNLDAPALPPRT